MGEKLSIVALRRGKEESLQRRHPWVFSGAIEKITEGSKPLAEGDIVDVVTKQGDFIARGHYQIGSIAVRVLTFDNEAIDQQWWDNRIAKAKELREAIGMVGNSSTTCYRLIHGEGDLLPGLVVDIYGSTAVVQCHSVGMYHSRHAIVEAIRKAYGELIEAIYDKSSQTLPYKAELGAIDGYLWGRNPEKENVVLENGLKFKVNWEEGQKTGFFIDQRENRDLVRQYSRGRRVLNTFCYTGGFSVAALAGGATEVVSIDLSERAVKLADENMKLNFGEDAPHQAIACNAVEYLKDIDEDFDLIILDPPAFAKHHKVLGNALQGYKKINVRALQKIRPGGILFTFSCSQAVSRDLFRTTIFTAAAIAGRRVRIIGQLTQPADHPIDIYHPEGEYLKGLVVYVE
ncbi:MAG: class I SAM-dependent rRNA methyltransferase [Alistipes sp.]|nr:class I SAM-dependent rRNA methyltransferase [Alistipes sp.]